MKTKIDIHNEVHELDVTKRGDIVEVRGGDTSEVVQVIDQQDGIVTLEINGRRIQMAGTTDGDKRQLWVNGRVVNYTRMRAGGAGGSTASQGSLTSNIPAVVSEILVAEGDTVQTGDKLILLESMKMIIPIQAPSDGTVKAILCAAGDAIQPGVPLVEIE